MCTSQASINSKVIDGRDANENNVEIESEGEGDRDDALILL
jgi:hypothetical protein